MIGERLLVLRLLIKEDERGGVAGGRRLGCEWRKVGGVSGPMLEEELNEGVRGEFKEDGDKKGVVEISGEEEGERGKRVAREELGEVRWNCLRKADGERLCEREPVGEGVGLRREAFKTKIVMYQAGETLNQLVEAGEQAEEID